jgi:hypothetical protein
MTEAGNSKIFSALFSFIFYLDERLPFYSSPVFYFFPIVGESSLRSTFLSRALSLRQQTG